jgi:aldose 1-epimerase
MSNFYYKQLKNDEGTVLLGFLSDDGLAQEAQISLQYGANLCRYSYGDSNIIDYDPVLMQTSDFTGTPVLYPTPNRVENGVFTFQGNAYKQVKRGRQIFEHGLVYDEKWDLVELYTTDKGAVLTAQISWTLESPLYEAFPFPHSITLTFLLYDRGIDITYDILNFGSKVLPYGFGLHPYFQKLSGEENTFIKVPVKQVMETTEEMLPTGNIMPVGNTPFDLNLLTSIGKLDLDHVFLREVSGQPAIIYYPDQGFSVQISASEDFSHYVVYSPAGMPYFCIESQTCSTNAHNLFHRGLSEISGLKMVAPGEHKTGTVKYKISLDNSYIQ